MDCQCGMCIFIQFVDFVYFDISPTLYLSGFCGLCGFCFFRQWISYFVGGFQYLGRPLCQPYLSLSASDLLFLACLWFHHFHHLSVDSFMFHSQLKTHIFTNFLIARLVGGKVLDRSEPLLAHHSNASVCSVCRWSHSFSSELLHLRRPRRTS